MSTDPKPDPAEAPADKPFWLRALTDGLPEPAPRQEPAPREPTLGEIVAAIRKMSEVDRRWLVSEVAEMLLVGPEAGNGAERPVRRRRPAH